MKSILPIFTLSLALPFAMQATTVTNPTSLFVDNNGEKIFLNAGVYQMSVSGGAWDESFYCDRSKTTTTEWSDAFDMTIAGQSTIDFSLKGNPTFTSAASALTNYKSGILFENGVAASAQNNLASFTIAKGGQYVQFDLPQCDLSNGVTLSIDPAATASATPEPSTFGLMGSVLFGGLALARRKMRRQA